jgi:hypothetical protein
VFDRATKKRSSCILGIGRFCFSRSKVDQADAVAAIEAFNDRMATKKPIWAWPTIGAALTSKLIWLIVACDSCGLMLDTDLTMKRRDPNASIQEALRDVKCPRCNGHGRSRITGLARFPSS